MRCSVGDIIGFEFYGWTKKNKKKCRFEYCSECTSCTSRWFRNENNQKIYYKFQIKCLVSERLSAFLYIALTITFTFLLTICCFCFKRNGRSLGRSIKWREENFFMALMIVNAYAHLSSEDIFFYYKKSSIDNRLVPQSLRFKNNWTPKFV